MKRIIVALAVFGVLLVAVIVVAVLNFRDEDSVAPVEPGAAARWLAAQPVPAQSKPASALPQALPIPCGVVVQVSKPVASK
ncbi:MAG: hypothetical protein E6H58_03145 [Betaproteobacteria bacterium]|nr:MAG: hypothetical protein E6H58_03145 [Betaproteobacteria bacterium]